MTAEQLLKKYIDFAATDRDSPALMTRANAFVLNVRRFQYGDVTPPPDEELSEEKAMSLHENLSGLLDGAANGRGIMTSATYATGRFTNGEGAQIYTSHGYSLSGTILTFFILMRMARVKAILRCPGCGCIFLRIKGRRKTCSDKCRARKCAKNRTAEQKEAIKKKRQERYLISKGGNK